MPVHAHDHPVFSRVYGVVAAVGERTGLGELRARVLAPAHGRLLIVGLGPGHDLEHLPPAVTSVVAVEPSEPMRHAARHRVEQIVAGGVEVEVVDALGEALPLEDDSVDSVLFAYVLCTIEDPAAALAEARRVLRPGGVVCVLEHVRAQQPRSFTGVLQRGVRPVWPRLTGGCHADRDTRAAFVAAGYDVEGLRDVTMLNIPPVTPTLIGTAR
ncbi:MAG: class I SAM-dependent methyltransferase [Candidatus Nanopelagicales bacterium]